MSGWEKRLLTEMAVDYYLNEITQEEIAKKFGISRIKVGRLLKQARQEGIVEISIPNHSILNVELEQKMLELFSIQRVLIAQDHPDEDEQRKRVASLVSKWLSQHIKDQMVIAVGQGRNISAVADHASVTVERECHFISCIGGSHRTGDFLNADHICRRLAKKYGGTSETLYAPAYVEKRSLKEALMKNQTVKATFDRACRADIALVGIGDINDGNYMVKLGWFTRQELKDASQQQGVIGDIAGYDFFNTHGKHVDTVMNDRVIGIGMEELRHIPYVIGIAAEHTKSLAILGALRSGVIDVIATSALNIRNILNLVSQ
ncbi:sugar-binding transcriptional regulator [Entomobacter blattae]|uniref:Transcriptional regulator LsrR n=1 Tax=Entomobacter blattae TaxID=2762277 RepID=A0A7H1NTW4_9PROT|nr:sugar-binding transcriptional regulator [Entomobacter blattae]QNT79224.1 Transcriptional regulator LsrR [Entomobacter blattae]